MFLGLGLIFAFGLSWASQPVLSLGLCVLCMLVFGYRRFCEAQLARDGDSLEIFGDQVYLLGYLFTIAAILGIFLQSHSAIGDELLNAGALKLTTTVVGLAVMCLFKETARLWNQEKTATIQDDNERLNSEVREAVRALVTDLAGLGGKLADMTKSLGADSPARMAEFARNLGLIGDVLPSLYQSVEQTANRLNSLHPHVQNFDDALVSARERGLEPMNGGLQACVDAAGKAAAGIRSAGESSERLDHSVQALLKSTSLAGPPMTAFAEQMRIAAQSVPRLNTAVGKAAERLEELHPEVQKLNSALIAAREQGVEPVAQGLRAVIINATGAEAGLDKTGRSAQRLSLALQTLGEHTEADGAKIQSINESFTHLTRSYSELEAYLQSLLRAQLPEGQSPLLMMQSVVQASAETVTQLNHQLAAANERMDALTRHTSIESSERLAEIQNHLANVCTILDANNQLLQRVIGLAKPPPSPPPAPPPVRPPPEVSRPPWWKKPFGS